MNLKYLKYLKGKKVAVLLSGGVDSSVSLALLNQEINNVPFELKAFYLKVWLQDEYTALGDCPWVEDLQYAEEVCKMFNVSLQVMNLQKEYWDMVVHYTLEEVKEGRTPNPDILCNSKIKFGVFIDKLKDEYDYIASGHYARLTRENNSLQLTATKDLIKDQTYFLSYLSKDQLNKCIFPLGEIDLLKGEVRKLAEKFELPNRHRKDSQGICFLGKIKFRNFIEIHMGKKKGKIVNRQNGEILGEHFGYWYYTLGQRQGLGLSGGPWYVVGKEVKTNTIFVSHQNDYQNHYILMNNKNEINNKTEENLKLKISKINILEYERLKDSIGNINNQQINEAQFYVKVRHGTTTHPCRISFINLADKQLEIEFIGDKQDLGAAPGQFAVIYQDRVCVLSGIIDH